jgi:hypothetical protein
MCINWFYITAINMTSVTSTSKESQPQYNLDIRPSRGHNSTTTCREIMSQFDFHI